MIATRRQVVTAIAAFVSMMPGRSHGAEPARIVVNKDPQCGCCNGWVEHLKHNGFVVETVDAQDINRVKARLGVPSELWACHTAEAEGYIFEGHVPASALRRFLSERPKALGLSVPGMPSGSPGMEVAGLHADDYSVILFGPEGQRTYARFKGAQELPL